MLAPDDAAIVERDRELPGLATLLDETRFLQTLQSHLPDSPATFHAARANYVRYKPGVSCLVGYELATSAGVADAYASALRSGEVDKLSKSPKHAVTSPVAGVPHVVVPHEALSVVFAPNDREVAGIGLLWGVSTRRDFINLLLPEQPRLWHAAPQRLAYKPERRHVALLADDTDAPRIVVKLYSAAGYGAARCAAKACSRVAGVEVQRLAGRYDRRQALAFGWLQGVPLTALLRGADGHATVVPVVERVGEAIARLHHVPRTAYALPTQTAATEVARLNAAASSIEALVPSLGGRVRQLAQDLAPHLTLDTPGLVHGDFYDAQVLVNRDQIAFLDFDEAAVGAAAQDIGNFIAHLHADALATALSQEWVESLSASLLRGYGGTGHMAQTAGLWSVAALLRLAPEPFRTRRDGWAVLTESIIRRAEELFAGAVGGARRAPVRARPSHAATARIGDDPALAPLVAPALDRGKAADLFGQAFSEERGHRCRVDVMRARIVRHKQGRRCLIEYELKLRSDTGVEQLAAIGKVRAKSLDRNTYDVVRWLHRHGFGDDSLDEVYVPEPLCAVPALNMWLQRSIKGTPLTAHIEHTPNADLFRRVAEAAAKVHCSRVDPARRHSMTDELDILQRRLDLVAMEIPELAPRLRRLLEECRATAMGIEPPIPRPIHRDFYADQVLVAGGSLYLLDFDLCCLGDPALDIGNFVAHLTELALRRHGDATTFARCERAVHERFVELEGPAAGSRAEVYAALTLARHIHISHSMAARNKIVLPLLELCEHRVALLREAQAERTPDPTSLASK
jgi:Ser/Thr protein kinase RdoA (MazF antagonist)